MKLFLVVLSTLDRPGNGCGYERREGLWIYQ